MKIVLAGLLLENEVDGDVLFEESKSLALAKGYEVVSEVIQRRRTPHPATYFGEGKLKEIKEVIEEYQAEGCMIAQKITPSQMRILRDFLGVRVFDRNDCILEIFEDRAQTKQAKLQVELARLKHELPFVIHTQQNFSRMRGGSKNKGEGEKQYQLDRRKYEIRIQNVEKALKDVKKSHEVMKKKRVNSHLKLISLAGYTNAGKSTCMNQILRLCDKKEDKEVFVKDMLFATLDTSVRHVSYHGVEFLLSDTVGFVSQLPHELIDAFHSTLESISDADLILQVVDESSLQKEENIQVTTDTLRKLSVEETPMWILHNKCDEAEFKKNEKDHYYISAKENIGLEAVLDAIVEFVKKDVEVLELFVPYDEASVFGLIQKKAKMLSCDEGDEGWMIQVEVDRHLVSVFGKYVK